MKNKLLLVSCALFLFSGTAFANLSDGKIDMSNLAELAWSYIERAIRKDNEKDGR